jgi:hypothetical protein
MRYEVLKVLNMSIVVQGSNVKMEAIHSFETLVTTYKTTRLTTRKV